MLTMSLRIYDLCSVQSAICTSLAVFAFSMPSFCTGYHCLEFLTVTDLYWFVLPMLTVYFFTAYFF